MKALRWMILAGAVLTTASINSAQAAKHWDPYTGIVFNVAGVDDAMAPSDEGDNGIQQDTYTVTAYDDVDHWIDDDESVPVHEGFPDESLPYADINYSTDAGPAPPEATSCLTFNGSLTDNVTTGPGTFTFTAPDAEGVFNMYFTGTDDDQVIPPGETGTRHDTDNTDNWWDISP